MARVAAQGGWASEAPEQLPRLTVRWEDPGQREVFVVEGERYRARVATQPARILSLAVDGHDLLGPDGMSLALSDAAGRDYEPCPAETRPEWSVWRRQWAAATDSRARMNVWSASPYYWDAHLLDIPLVTSDSVRAAASAAQSAPLVEWRFDASDAGWTAANHCDAAPGAEGWKLTATGDDPYVVAPPLTAAGPVRIALRARCSQGGGTAFYWGEDGAPGFSGERVTTFALAGVGQWHEYLIDLPTKAPLAALRFDPPGGTTELAWLRVVAVPPRDPNIPPPMRGEVTFHAHPDELRIELRTDPTAGEPLAARATLAAGRAPEELAALGGRTLARYGAADVSALLLCPAGGDIDPATGAWSAPLTGDRPGAVWILRPAGAGEEPAEAFAEELDPLEAARVEIRDGYWLGYDHAAGLYRVQATLHHPAYGFEANFVNPGRRVSTGIRLRNDARPRRMTVKCLTGIGNLEAAVLADDAGFPLPTPAFVAKNFAGELEEPDDSAFGDSYFPLTLSVGEERSFQVLHINQLWGNHLLKQVSSIRFFCIYWHLSTGASETTCFTHNWLEAGRSGAFTIPDFRPLSGPFWPGQPQHGCEQWPGFLQYNHGKARLVYERTDFTSISPCLARFTAHYRTSDDAATATVGILEIPQKDEMRTFVRLRYDWTKSVEIEGDARESFRWMNLYEFTTPPTLLYTDASGATRQVAVEPGPPALLGEPLSTASPFVASHAPGERYGCVALVRGFRARLGGVETDQAAVSAQFAPENGCWWLTVPREQLSLQPGDYLEAEVMLMPHGEPSPPETKPERERTERFGMGLPRVTEVSAGRKLSDFPATLRAEEEVAGCTLEGGFDAMPLIVEGFRGWGVPLLWRDGVWQDQQLHGGDGYQVEPDGAGGYRFTFVYPIRRGQTIPLLVTRAECSTGISRLVDHNGFPRLEAPTPGRFRLKAPMLFGPGTNTVVPGAPVVTFEGEAAVVRGLPLSVESAQPVTVEVDAGGLSVTVRGGPAVVRFGGLQTGRVYAVAVGDMEREMVATEGSLRVEVTGTESHVAVAPL